MAMLPKTVYVFCEGFCVPFAEDSSPCGGRIVPHPKNKRAAQHTRTPCKRRNEPRRKKRTDAADVAGACVRPPFVPESLQKAGAAHLTSGKQHFAAAERAETPPSRLFPRRTPVPPSDTFLFFVKVCCIQSPHKNASLSSYIFPPPKEKIARCNSPRFRPVIYFYFTTY